METRSKAAILGKENVLVDQVIKWAKQALVEAGEGITRRSPQTNAATFPDQKPHEKSQLEEVTNQYKEKQIWPILSG